MAGINASDPRAQQITQQIRSSPAYQAWVQRNGLNSRQTASGYTATSSLNSPLRGLSEAQRRDLQATLQSAGIAIPDGYELDDSGGVGKQTHNLRNFGLSAAAIVGGPMVASYLAGSGAAAAPSIIGNPAFATPLEAFPAAGGAAAGGAAAGSVLPATSTAFAGGAGSSVPTIAGSNLAGGTITGSGLSATPSLASRISTVGRFASNMAGERAGARLAEDSANQNYDRTQLEGARLNLDAPGMRLKNSLRGDLAAGLQPVSFTGSGRDLRMSGGVSPALLSDNSRQLGQQVSRDALLSQMNGPAFTPTPRPKPNGFDKALNIGGTAAGLYGAYKGLF